MGVAMETSPEQATESFGETQSSAKPLYSIGDIAREFSVSLRALRFYEDRGLLHPHRRGTTRLYSDRERSHLQMILKGKQLGFTLTEIREFLTARGDAIEDLDLELSLHPDQIIAQIRHLERQRDGLEAALAELREVHQRAQQTNAHLGAA